MVTFISQRAAEATKLLRARAQMTKYLRYLTDAGQVFELVRPANTWDAGAERERYAAGPVVRCKVYSLGAGGPRITDVIVPTSPYRVRVLAADFLGPNGEVPSIMNRLLVVNNARVFRIDDLKVDDGDDLLADLYVTEQPGAALPEVI